MRLGLIELGKQLASLVFVAGVAAEGEQRVRGERDEVIQRHTTRDILDVRIQAAILVHHQDGGQLALGFCRSDEVTAQSAVALGRGILDVAGFEACVVRGNLLRSGEVGTECEQQALGGGAGDGKPPSAVEKVAARQPPVHVLVEQVQRFGMKVFGGLTGHGVVLVLHEYTCGGRKPLGRSGRKKILTALSRPLPTPIPQRAASGNVGEAMRASAWRVLSQASFIEVPLYEHSPTGLTTSGLCPYAFAPARARCPGEIVVT